MCDDRLVEEMRRIKEQHAARYNYDIRAMARDLRDEQKRGRRKVVPAPRKSVRV